jgi:hypothetical protein
VNQLDLKTVLKIFRTPSSSSSAAERVGLPKPVVDGLLTQLYARGMVVPADPGVGACRSGCGLCSMQNFCPQSDRDSEKVPPSSLINPKVWRLTPLGEQSVR